METTNTNNQEISVTDFQGVSKFGAVDDGTYRTMYKGFRPYHDTTGSFVAQYGEQKGYRLMFEITTGPFKGKMVSYKGKMYRNDDTGQWVIGKKSKLADAIRAITGGSETINASHMGSQVFVVVKNSIGGPTSKNPGKPFPNVKDVLVMPRDMMVDVSTLNVKRSEPVATTPAPITPAAVVAKAAALPLAPAQAVTNPDLINELGDLSDFNNL